MVQPKQRGIQQPIILAVQTKSYVNLKLCVAGGGIIICFYAFGTDMYMVTYTIFAQYLHDHVVVM